VDAPADFRVVDEAVAAAAARSGVEAEPVAADYREVEGLLGAAGPVVLRRPGGSRWLAVEAAGGGRLRLLGPDGAVRSSSAAEVARALRAPLETAAAGEADRLLERAGVPPPARARAARALLAARLGGEPCAEGWTLRLPPGAGALGQLRAAGLVGHLGRLVAAQIVAYLLLIAAWAVVGRGVLGGRLEPGWVGAWGLLLATLIAVQAAGLWSQGVVALGAGALLKRRLLHGALRLDPEEIRHQGAGELLGRVIESERVEELALAGGFLALLSAVELVLAAGVLSLGAAGRLHLALLAGWSLGLGLLAWRLLGERGAWARLRIGMTHRMVERLLGHRTRLAQEPGDRWHLEEDAELEAYLVRSRRLDRLVPRLEVFATRGWLLAGLAALAPALLSGRASTAGVAVSLGGILLALEAFQGVAGGLFGLTGAAVGWERVAPLYRAAARPLPAGSPEVAGDEVARSHPHGHPRGKPRGGSGASPPAASSTGSEARRYPPGPVLAARGLTFRYPGRARPALAGCDLALDAGDRVLLTGSSGSGKSTLVSLLAALRRPDSGLLLLHGADLAAWGALGWHRRVAAAPQFHDNHLFAAPLAFNLLLGRGWPPTAEDVREAAELCDELGLGDLVARMPAGLMQPVGETGWRLSHGEASRVYLARALLQDADVVLLDESFAALDPESLARSLDCARRRARTLVVVTHR
jgi:ATP-binding cassette subfamily B protein